MRVRCVAFVCAALCVTAAFGCAAEGRVAELGAGDAAPIPEAPDGGDVWAEVLDAGGGADAGAPEPPRPACTAPKAPAGGTLSRPRVRSVAFANMPLAAVEAGPGGFHAGIDLSLGGYVPGHHAEDPYYGANVMASVGPLSYYRVIGPGDFPFGVFIHNEDPNDCRRCAPGEGCAAWCADMCSESFAHGWADRVTSASLEFYPKDAGYGGVRVEVPGFSHFANGGVYSPDLGVVVLPHAGDAGITKLNGFVYQTRGGATAPEGRFTVDIFHFGPERHTSTGVPMRGFGSTHVNGDGYYRFDALFSGRHKTYLTDNATGRKKVVWLDLHDPDVRLDFVLGEPCFGMPTCEDP